MPLSDQLDALYFDDTNVTEFLERFQKQCQEHYVKISDRFRKLLRYCETLIDNFVKIISAWTLQNWKDLVKFMKKKYKRNDIQQKLNSRYFLKMFKSKPRSNKNDLRSYSRQFRSIVIKLIAKRQLDEYTCS